MPTPTWATLFDRAAGFEVADGAIADTLFDRRSGAATQPADSSDPTESLDRDPADPAPTRVVADADVLAADLFRSGPSRDALDHLRAHSWTTLVASDHLLADAEAVVETLADDAIGGEWRDRIDVWRASVGHPPGDQPALASARAGGAMHVLSLNARLRSPGAGLAVRDRVETSVRHPEAFARLFDPEGLYEHAVGGTYEGPDRDPRT